jgi:DNA polymerase-1
MLDNLPFAEAWVLDFEFNAPPGERPIPLCMVAREVRTGRTVRLWQDQFGPMPPFSIGCNTVVVAFFASADLGCFRALGWPAPAYVLDPFVEFRNRTNGLPLPAGRGLIGAMTYFGLDTVGAAEKDEKRKLVLAGGPWSQEERAEILDYCESDVVALERLLLAMLPRIDLPRSLLRGRFMTAVAAIEWAGVPIDAPMLELFTEHWDGIKDALIAEIDADYGVFDGRTFKADRWAQWLASNDIPWPRTETGALSLADGTFRDMAKAYPRVSPVRELRSALSDMRLNDLAVGRDARNRTLLSPFGARTGRNTPSNTRYIFGPSVWLRGLVKPQPGYGMAYIDWSQQEFAIAAKLSGDTAMQAAYESGDPYLEFAKQANAVPSDATKETHGPTRELFKQCVLATQYGQGAEGLACRIGQSPAVARDLLRAHRETYPTFWRWSDAAVDCAMLNGSIHTVFGWTIQVGENPNPRSLRNFPCQANGAEMLRVACCLATERGVEVCAPVHDAILITAPLNRLDQDISRAQAAMAEASRVVLDGLELRTDAKRVVYPDRYTDPRGAVMWNRVTGLIAARLRRREVA